MRGTATHLSHDDLARVQAYPMSNRWESRDKMFRQALDNYDRADFHGTYEADTCGWLGPPSSDPVARPRTHSRTAAVHSASQYCFRMRRLPHGYTNRTVGDGTVVVKTYVGPDAALRAEREDRALSIVSARVSVPPVLHRAPDALTLGFLAGSHGQDLIMAGHAGPVLATCGSVLRDIHAAGVGHGDFGPHNVLLDAATFAPVAVLDWEFAIIPLADLVADLAWCEWIRANPPPHACRCDSRVIRRLRHQAAMAAAPRGDDQALPRAAGLRTPVGTGWRGGTFLAVPPRRHPAMAGDTGLVRVRPAPLVPRRDPAADIRRPAPSRVRIPEPPPCVATPPVAGRGGGTS